jgi:glucosamine-6-phosphate deaminase
MLVFIDADAEALARRAADLVEQLLAARPAAVLGLAAGATPLRLYAELVERQLNFAQATVFGLDEYREITGEHPSSCADTLRRHLIERVNLAPQRVHLLDGTVEDDLPAYCAAYEAAIAAAGGLDLQILGLGVNGHVGFNEPGCSLAGRTHPAALSAATRITNRPHFPPPGEVPRTAVTMGVGTILAARRVMLLATGGAKAEMVARMVEGPVTARVPASALQLHPEAVVLLDEAAASGLAFRADYEASSAARRLSFGS